MTSEVVAMNRNGIALAADSVISVYSDGVHKKRHNTGSKLFALSEVHPVGIMVYNNSSLLEVPWETIIKVFQKSLGPRSFPKLEDYGYELINFLQKQNTMFPEEAQQRHFLIKFQSQCNAIKNECEQMITQLDSEQVENSNRDAICSETVQQYLTRWTQQRNAEMLTERQANEFLANIIAEVSTIVDNVFRDWSLSTETTEQLRHIATLLIYKLNLSDELHTGVVIGGFGDVEHLPAVQSLAIVSKFGDVLKWKELGVERINQDRQSHIDTFAESRAVAGFVMGLYPNLYQLNQEFDELVRDLSAVTSALTLNLDRQEILDFSAEALINKVALLQNLTVRSTFLIQSRVNEVLEAIRTFPISDLAKVARNFVQLSSFEQQLSFQVETVGEPIDVAVISKGDGLVWFKRKTHFQSVT